MRPRWHPGSSPLRSQRLVRGSNPSHRIDNPAATRQRHEANKNGRIRTHYVGFGDQLLSQEHVLISSPGGIRTHTFPVLSGGGLPVAYRAAVPGAGIEPALTGSKPVGLPLADPGDKTKKAERRVTPGLESSFERMSVNSADDRVADVAASNTAAMNRESLVVVSPVPQEFK